MNERLIYKQKIQSIEKNSESLLGMNIDWSNDEEIPPVGDKISASKDLWEKTVTFRSIVHEIWHINFSVTADINLALFFILLFFKLWIFYKNH